MKMTPEILQQIAENLDVVVTNEYREKEYQAYDSKFCFALTLFFKQGLKDNKKGLLRFYKKALDVIGKDNFTYYLVNNRGVYKKCKRDTFDMFPFWLEDDDGGYKYGLFSLNLESDVRESMSDKAFKIYGFSPDDDKEDGKEFWVSGIRLIVPADYVLKNGVTKWLSIVDDATHDLEFISGYSGFSMNSEYANAKYLSKDYNEDRPTFSSIVRRYQGIDVDQYERYVYQ